MDKRTLNPNENPDGTSNGAEWFVLLYSLGALIGLLCAFQSTLTPLQTTNCLVLSWLLALGALVVSLLCDSQEPEEETDQYFDDY